MRDWRGRGLRPEFATAIRQKLLLEIAGLDPPPALRPQRLAEDQGGLAVTPVQALPGQVMPAGKYDCLIGEKRWQQFLRDGYNE